MLQRIAYPHILKKKNIVSEGRTLPYIKVKKICSREVVYPHIFNNTFIYTNMPTGSILITHAH